MSIEESSIFMTVPTPLELSVGLDGYLRVKHGQYLQLVTAHRCFPWSQADKYISLRDSDGSEVALIYQPKVELDIASQVALQTALAESAFIFEVERILHVEEEIEIRNWTVVTKQGHRSFQTTRDTWPQCIKDGEYLIQDVSGDIYRITLATQSDGHSRRYLFAFVE